MTQDVLRALQHVLQARWFARLPGLVLRSERLLSGLSAKEAFTEGYREGYWAAVEDLASSDLLKEPRSQVSATYH